MKQKIHIMGAGGSGTTSIAKAVCEKLNYTHFDSDSYYWMPTKEPFTLERPKEEQIELLENDMSGVGQWILSGARVADVFTPAFELVAFVYVPTDIKMERLRKREYERYGDRVLPGGDMHESSKKFLEWCASYDTGTTFGRNLQKHEAWLATVTCPVLRIVNDSLDESVNAVIEAINL